MITKSKEQLMDCDINEEEILSIEDFVDELVDEGVGEEQEFVDSYQEFLKDIEAYDDE